MDKKGFTLIELLAVIIILGVVMLIATVSITGIRDNINKSMFESKLDLAIGTAKTWGQDNRELLTKEITIGELIGEELLKTDEKVTLEQYSACEEYNKTSDGGCLVVTNNIDGSVVNKLKLKVYIQYNRVYACILQTEDNKNILNEDSEWSVFGELKYYCN